MSVGLYSIYSEDNGFKFSRRMLIKLLAEYFGDEVVLLFSPSLANIHAFKSCCYFALRREKDRANKNLRIIVAAMKAESSATDRNQCKVQFDFDKVNEDFSATWRT